MKRYFPFLPFLFSWHAVLDLYSQNISEIPADAVWRPLLASTLLAGLLTLVSYGLTRNWRKSGLISAFLLLLFFTYGHVYALLKDVLQWKDVLVGGVYIFRHPALTRIWLALGIAGTFLLYRVRNPAPLLQFANATAIILLLFPVADIGAYAIKSALQKAPASEQVSSNLTLPAGTRPPDVYFIVLDAYGRSDVLQDVFDLDNSEFLDNLQAMGFEVVECSQSNYARTKLSMASTLNMDYIQNLPHPADSGGPNSWLRPYLQQSRVRAELEALGYKSIAFYNGFPWLEWKDADYYLNAGEKSALRLGLAKSVSRFEEVLMNTTMIRSVIDIKFAGAASFSAPSHRETILFTVNTLPEVAKIPEAKFVYAHLILPHPPFVFGPAGEEINIGDTGEEENDLAFYQDEAMRRYYRDQTQYTPTLILPMLEAILAESAVPPIIILESDHGPTSYGGIQNRMANFMAFHLPNPPQPVDEIAFDTPVNSFRLVFNTYFGGSLPYLEDVSYYSESTNDVEYQIVPNSCADT